MASINARQRDPLLDQNTQAMLERRGRELLGMGLLLLAGLFVLMLSSYSPEDPGWMVATDAPAHNILGRMGAAIASTLIIIGGKGAWMIPFILGAWGVRFVSHRGADRAMGRVVFAVIAVALASVYAATLVPGADWPHSFGLGGLFGDTILGAMLGVAPVNAGLGLNLFSMILGMMLMVMALWVTGFTRFELALIARFLMLGAVHAYNLALGVAGSGTARAAAAIAERRALRAEERSYAAQEAEADWHQPAPMAAAMRGSVIRRSAEVETLPPPLAQAAALGATQVSTQAHAGEWGRPASLKGTLRADPRYAEPMADAAQYAPPRERAGLLSRMPQLMRRVAEPEPELIEPMLSAQADLAVAPNDDRIKARISDAIRSRNGQPAPNLNPIQAAIQRREPPVARTAQQSAITRLRGPRPLIADTRRPANPLDLPAEPPLTAAQIVPMTSPVPSVAKRMPSIQTAPPAPPVIETDDTDWDDEIDFTESQSTYARSPAPSLAQDRLDEVVDRNTQPEWLSEDDEDFDDALHYDPTPVVRQPLPSFAAEPKKPVVQHVVKKPALPSRQALAESQPRLKFEEQVSQAYELPPLALLASPATVQRYTLSDEALEENARMLESVLDDYGVKGEIVSVRPGPVVTMYELEPAPGLKASRVIGLADDIARSMSALSARVSTVPGRSVIGIELPNSTREKVVLREILAARDFGDSNMRLPLALGKDIGGDPIVANLAKMPHLLIAGTTGSGKSVAINTMILSLLYKLTPEECRLIMIDPKMLELSVYDGIPHLLSPVVTDPKKAVVALKWVVGEMEERYRKMSKMGVRNIEGYNGRVREALAKGEMFKRTIQTGFDEDTGEPVFETDEFAPVAIPYIVVIVDEMADLMMVAGKEIEACIQRLAQMARASGIHLIMATQRPSVDVITGTIKANFPTRISFQVTSKIDSRTILGEQGAEQLLGMGDMLYMGNGAKITRIHGPFVSDEEVEEIVNHLKSFGPPVYMSGVVEGPDEDAASDIDVVLGLSSGEGGDDALYDQAVAIVAKDRKCSTSYIQRKLGIGYNKAARLVEQMEDQGIVTAANHVGKREILIPET
jgi:DNA segregation ATPase FtsK/SpoIIIE, S-DNA-T family